MDDHTAPFLPLLSPARHKKYLDDYQLLCLEGVPPDRAARDALAGTMGGIVRKYARSLCRGWPATTGEDAYAEGFVGVARATQQFDPGRGIMFSSYAARAAIRAIMNYRRLATRFGFSRTNGAFVPGPVSDSAIGDSDESSWMRNACPDWRPEPGQDDGWDADVWDRIAGAIVGNNYREAFLRYYRDRKTFREIALELGVCYNRVSQYLHAATHRLRRKSLDGEVYLPGQEEFVVELGS